MVTYELFYCPESHDSSGTPLRLCAFLAARLTSNVGSGAEIPDDDESWTPNRVPMSLISTSSLRVAGERCWQEARLSLKTDYTVGP